jgi:hypothetical protein
MSRESGFAQRTSGGRSSPSIFGCWYIGQTAMRRAIGFPPNSRRAAEVKTILLGRTQGPAAHARSELLQSDDTLVVRLGRRRQSAFGQLEAGGFADDRIFRNAQLATNFTGADPFVPQCDECRGPFRSPFIPRK